MLESQIEKHLRNGIVHMGGLCYKFVSPGHDGVPDRLIIMPDGGVYFVELKTETGRLSPIQRNQIRRLAEKNADVTVVKGDSGVTDFLTRLQRETKSDGI